MEQSWEPSALGAAREAWPLTAPTSGWRTTTAIRCRSYSARSPGLEFARDCARFRGSLDELAKPARERAQGVNESSVRECNRPQLDRKSTRLNSSHLGISYAVFCL